MSEFVEGYRAAERHLLRAEHIREYSGSALDRPYARGWNQAIKEFKTGEYQPQKELTRLLR